MMHVWQVSSNNNKEMGQIETQHSSYGYGASRLCLTRDFDFGLIVQQWEVENDRIACKVET